MAKLIALALAFAALVAFATAHTTIVTTTIEDENPVSRQRQCSQQLQGQRGQQQQGIQQCCQELQNVEEQCQCEAVKQVFRDVQQQQGQFGSQQTQQLKQRAQMIPNQCNLQSRQCQIGNIMTESNIDIPFRSGSQQCRESEIQRPVNQCQRECQCEAVEEVARKVMRQQQQGGRRQYGGQQDEREMVRRVVQNLPNQCYLDVKQCSIPYGTDA
ncbi:hypothetical protein L1987_85143 [Smallanthus sonchifolius]|uniref:Uncharacterized protein n=1 Tax=Smallanthus sonchifolius TaxID=185202 RepID=A0ACB8XWD4_9ASTR|nr:hypothetical protein L1987_85143 [Smallanthus sonchifolius]